MKPSVEVIGPKKTAPALYGHSMTRLKNKLYMFGGRTGLTSYSNSIFEYNTETNTLRLIALPDGAAVPSPRQGHSVVAINDNDMLVFGGRDGSAISNELWMFDTAKEQWKQIKSTGDAPQPLEGHAAVLKQSKMYVFGGNDGRELSSDIFVLDLTSFKWQRLASQGRPRAYHTATLIGNYIYIIAGGISNEELGDVHVFDTTTERWVSLSHPIGTLPKRQGHCAVGYKTGVYVFGGSTGWKTRFNDIRVLDTDPESTKKRLSLKDSQKPKKELSAEIEDMIVSINLLADVSDKKVSEDSAIEREIAELITKDKDDQEFAGLPKKIAIWRQIGDLYQQLTVLKEGISATKISKQAESITHVHDDYVALKKKLAEDGNKLKLKLDGLKQHEEHAANSKRVVNEINISMESVSNTTRRLSIEIETLEKDLVEQNRKITTINDNINNYEKRLSSIRTELADEGATDKDKEKTLLMLLEELNTKAATVQAEINESSSKVHTLSISVSNTERQLSRLDDLRREIEELKSKFERTMESQQIYESSKELLIKRLEQSDIGGALPPQVSKNMGSSDDAKWLEQLLRDNQATYEKQLSDKKVELGKNEAIHESKRKEIKTIRDEIDSTKKELERVQARLRNQETLRKEYDSEASALEQRIVVMNKHLEEEKQSLQSMSTRLTKAKNEYTEARSKSETIAEELRKAKKEETEAQRTLAGFKSELQGGYATLSQTLSQCRQLGDSLETLRSEIVNSRNEYIGQREGLERARESIINKLAESEDVSAQLVRSLEVEIGKLQLSCAPAQ